MIKRPAISKLIQDYIRDHIIREKLRPGEAMPVQGKIAEEPDRAFHQVLYRSTGNQLLLRLSDVFWMA